MVAPYSGDILAIVALSANDNLPIPSPTEQKPWKQVTKRAQAENKEEMNAR